MGKKMRKKIFHFYLLKKQVKYFLIKTLSVVPAQYILVKSSIQTENGILKYHYEIEVFICTGNVYENYSHREQFKYDDLMEAREKAFSRRQEIISLLKHQGMFFLPFASNADFIQGKNALYTVSLILIEEINDDVEIYVLEGNEKYLLPEDLKREKEILERLTINQS